MANVTQVSDVANGPLVDLVSRIKWWVLREELRTDDICRRIISSIRKRPRVSGVQLHVSLKFKYLPCISDQVLASNYICMYTSVVRKVRGQCEIPAKLLCMDGVYCIKWLSIENKYAKNHMNLKYF